ncbi:MAG: DUF2783 domain-containing protein [Telluria sp.]
MNPHLKLAQNLDDFEAFYNMLDASHAGLDRTGSVILNAQLVLLLANHIGDMAVLREAFALARVKLDMIRPDPANATTSSQG